MTFIEKLKISLYNRRLTKALQEAGNVEHHSVDFDQAKTIGILFDASTLENRDVIKKYVDLLKRSGKTVKLMGYLDEHEQEPNLGFKHFAKKDIDFSHRPKTEEVKAFINKRLDVLLNLYVVPTLSLEYISALSKATFRVGPISDNTDCYDLMVQTNKQNDLRHFIQQVEFFLKKMNLKHEASAI